MSKKIKPVFEDAAVEVTNDICEANNQAEEQKAKQQQHVGPKSLTKEMLEKLDHYDAIVESNKVLLKEKDELTSKASEMIAELDKLRYKDVEIEKLNRKIEELQKTSDEYLVRISDLTYENAKLTCQLQTLSNDQQNTKLESSSQSPIRRETFAPQKDPYNPYKQNGYLAWN